MKNNKPEKFKLICKKCRAARTPSSHVVAKDTLSVGGEDSDSGKLTLICQKCGEEEVIGVTP